MEIVSCDFCNTKEHKIICTQTDIVHKTSNDFFQIVECAKCGLNFTNPRPKENEISKFYPEKRFLKRLTPDQCFAFPISTSRRTQMPAENFARRS